MPNEIRCYDNGGRTFDRYTVVYMFDPESKPGTFAAVGMSDNPFSPSGFGQHCSAAPGRHLGNRIPFLRLPDDCRKLVLRDLYGAIWREKPLEINALLRANPRPCRYGAPLGAMNRDAAPGHVRRYCQRVRFTDGDYGADGTYWGSGGGPLYAVFTQNLETLCYFRAPNRAAALAQYAGGKR